MNLMIELEAKFEVPHLTTGRFEAWCWKRSEADLMENGAFNKLAGIDTFFAGNGVVLRYRRAAPEEPAAGSPVLTYKCRQRPGDIRDRIEVDLFLDEKRATEPQVKAFVQALGLREHFTILKESTIVHFGEKGAIIVVALYDVLHQGQIRRFLEVEIEKSSEISDEDAAMVLSDWILEMQKDLGIGSPINQSLYEMFAPRDSLFLPESF